MLVLSVYVNCVLARWAAYAITSIGTRAMTFDGFLDEFTPQQVQALLNSERVITLDQTADHAVELFGACAW